MAHVRALLASVLAAFAAATADAAGATAPRPLTPDDFYNIQTLTDPQVSPDGKWVAYVVSTNDRDADEDRDAIWMVSWDGTQQLPLTNPARGTSSPRWSRDGRYLAYMATPAGSEKTQIMLLDRRGGEPKALTGTTDEIESFEWSPDSKHLVLVMQPSAAEPTAAARADSAPGSDESASTPPEAPQKPDSSKAAAERPRPIVIDTLHFKEDKDGYLGAGYNRHLYVLDIDTKRLDPLTDDPGFNEDLPTWSPDSRRIAFVRTRERGPDIDGMQDIDVIEVGHGEQSPQARSTRAAHSGATPSSPVPVRLVRAFVPDQQKLAWSPDGTMLAFLQGTEPRYAQYSQDRLAVARASGGAPPRSLTDALDRKITSYTFDRDPVAITLAVEDDGEVYPATLNIPSGTIRALVRGPFVVTDLSSAAGHTALLHSSDTSAAEIYALEGAHLRKLTHHNDSFMSAVQLGAVEDLRFTSADGTPVHGLLVKPPGFEPGHRYPTILWIHGGPNLQDEHALDFDGYQFKRQLLAANGFVVFGVNYRGSSGRGQAFSRAIAADWGHKEVEDLLAGLEAVIRTGVADPGLLGIGGWSYGGMLTDYTIASDTRFKAAISGAGTANPLALYGADQYNIQYSSELGEPWRNSALYLKLAYPFLHADRISTPTLFMGGDKDFNVPIVGGEQMYLALRTLGVPAQLVVYPGQYHTLTRPSFLKDRLERMVEWYRKYLQPPANHLVMH